MYFILDIPEHCDLDYTLYTLRLNTYGKVL